MTGSTIEELDRLIASVRRRLPGSLTAEPELDPPFAPALLTADEAARLSDREIARWIDHTLLKSDAVPEQLDRLCDEAMRLGCAAVCVHPCRVAHCKRRLAGSGVGLATVVGFPLGATTTACKAAEAGELAALGADELDMVINVGLLKAGDDAVVFGDIRAVVGAARSATHRARVKTIIETALLDDEQKVRACLIARAAGATFVKTCTGFQGGGATPADVALMRRTVGARLGVKASGGIRAALDARALLAAGADRLGASSTLAIVGQTWSDKA
jgi:deoxyribose-phosphate aldolase